MKHRPITGRFFPSAGPQALAVFSCALALLAINPAALRADGGTPTVLAHLQGQPASESGAVVLDVTPSATLGTPSLRSRIRRSKLSTNVAQKHPSALLNTMALFNAVLVRHFAPVTQQPILTPNNAILAGQHALAVRGPVAFAASPAGANREQRFVLTHLLLAPPV